MPTCNQRFTACRFLSLIACFATVSVFTFRLSATSITSITYNFDHTLRGIAPVGPTPWLTAVVSDSGANAVQLTLAAPGLTGDEYVGQWYFNLNPALNPASL